MTVEVRACVPEDVQEVVLLALRAWAPVFGSFQQVLGERIYQLVYPDWLTSQAEAVADVCRGPHVWVAVQDDRPIGFVAVAHREASKSAEIDMIAVDPDYQRRGVGSRLMAVAVAFMRQAGVEVAEVATGGDPGHAAARHTYEKAGFTALPLVRYYKAL